MSVLGSSDLGSESREVREDRVRKDLKRRLEHVCENLATEDFESLVVKMTHEQLRGEGVSGRELRGSSGSPSS